MNEKQTIDVDIFAKELDATALQKVIDDTCEKAAPQFAILESLMHIAFPVPKKDAIKLAEWPKGRVFSKNFELRWEKNGNGYRTVFCKKKSRKPDDAPAWNAQLEIETSVVKDNFPDAEREPYAVFLRPERDNTLGRERDSEGRALYYACLDNTRKKDKQNENRQNVILEMKRYFDASGRLIFWRYQNMRWEK